jgi:hypothetical protein
MYRIDAFSFLIHKIASALSPTELSSAIKMPRMHRMPNARGTTKASAQKKIQRQMVVHLVAKTLEEAKANVLALSFKDVTPTTKKHTEKFSKNTCSESSSFELRRYIVRNKERTQRISRKM